MALIKCIECGREISDKAPNCIGCGAPMLNELSNKTTVPEIVTYNSESDTFTGTIHLLVKLAMKAIQQHGWTLEIVNENVGLVTFKTGVSWGSWAGVSCTLNIAEESLNTFRIIGTGKQISSGGKIAINIGNEAQNKAKKVIETMKSLANSQVYNSAKCQTEQSSEAQKSDNENIEKKKKDNWFTRP